MILIDKYSNSENSGGGNIEVVSDEANSSKSNKNALIFVASLVILVSAL